MGLCQRGFTNSKRKGGKGRKGKVIQYMGSCFKRERSKFYWIQYYKDGKAFRESTGTDSLSEARRILKLREGEVASGRFHGLNVEKIRLEDLVDDFIADYKINGRKSLRRAERSTRFLKKHFGNPKVVDITTRRIKAYIMARQESGRTNATINRELSALHRILSLGRSRRPLRSSRCHTYRSFERTMSEPDILKMRSTSH